jgi:hypothetical protein
MTTPLFGLPELSAAQNQKYLTVNETTRLVEAVLRNSVKESDINTPPGSPSVGDVYGVGSAPTGAWVGQAGKLAVRVTEAWTFLNVPVGFLVYDEYREGVVIKTVGGWIPVGLGVSTTQRGASLSVRTAEEVVSFPSEKIISSTIQFPNKSIPLFASVHVLAAVTGPAEVQWYTLDGSSVDHSFETNGVLSLGQRASGPANPMKPIYYDGSVRFEDASVAANSSAGASFTGGSAVVTLHWLEAGAARRA